MTKEQQAKGAFLGRALACGDAKISARAFKLVEIALTKHGGKLEKTASELGIGVTTLKDWMKQHERLSKHRDHLLSQRGLRAIK